MKTGKGFGADIQKFILKQEKRTEKFYRKVTVAAFGGVVNTSPVDVGTFALNWSIKVEHQNNMSITTDAVSVNQSQKSATIKSGSVNSAVNLINGKHDIFIANSMPYAYKLEHGHSDQAKNGIVSVVSKQIKAKIEQGAFNDK